jgi:hypothetical protein
MRRMLAAILLATTLVIGCANAPVTDPEDLPSVAPHASVLSTTSLVLADTCSIAVTAITAVTFPFWTPVPLIYGVYTHMTWDTFEEDVKPVQALFACFTLLEMQ